MTGLRRRYSLNPCHSDRANEVSDEESPVYTTQSSEAQSTYSRSSRQGLRPSSTVVFGFAYGSSRKASIKEFHQLVSLTVTTPLRMTGLGFPFLQICHSDRETVRFRRGIYSFILIYTDFFLTEKLTLVWVSFRVIFTTILIY